MKHTLVISALSLSLCIFASPLFAQASCQLITIDVGTDGACGENGAYVGPWSQADHGGTCLIPVGCQITTTQIREDKNCGNGTYIGPEEVKEHGGYCAEITGSSHTLVTRETSSKENCAEGWQYAGANRPDLHSGHCVRIFSN